MIQGLVRGITPEEARQQRKALVRVGSKIGALLVIALAVVVVLEVQSGSIIIDIFWSYPFFILGLLAAPVSIVIQYRRLRPSAPMTLEAAEALTPPGSPCPRCADIPLRGTAVCPTCGTLLRPVIAVLPGALLLLGALLVLLYRRGAFTP